MPDLSATLAYQPAGSSFNAGADPIVAYSVRVAIHHTAAPANAAVHHAKGGSHA